MITAEQFVEEIAKRYVHVEPLSQNDESQYQHETE